MERELGAPSIQTILERLLDAFNRHDLDAIMSFFAEDAVLEAPRGPDPWGRRFTGLAEVREGLASRFAGMLDVHYGGEHHWAFGDQFGVSEWTLTGTSAAGPVRVRGCDHYTFREGKIIRKDSYWKIVE